MRLNVLFGALFSAVALTAVASPSAFAEQQSSSQVTSATVVEVQPGDTLSKIATAHGTTYHRLFDANLSIADPDVIYAGESIRIPAADEVIASRALPSVVSEAPVVAAPQPVAEPAPAPAPQASIAPAPRAAAPLPAPQATSSNAGVWDRLAQCESGGNWAINTGNGYYGGLQFSLQSWQAVGGSGLPSNASKAEQIARAEQLLAIQGWGAWPACTAKLGIR